MLFILTQIKLIFTKKGFALGLLIFTENFPRDSWRYSYIQFKGNVIFLCCCFPHLHSCFCGVWESALSMGCANCRAKDIFSFNMQTKPSSSTQFVSLPFVLYTTWEALSKAWSVVAQAIARNKQANQTNFLKKKQLSACFLRVSAVILLSWFVGWVNLIGIHFQQTNLYRRFTKLISSYDPFTRYRVVNNDESVHVDRLKN